MFRDLQEIKSAVTVAVVFFFVSLVLAPALTRDQNNLAAEINSKTLKAAAAIKNSSHIAASYPTLDRVTDVAAIQAMAGGGHPAN